VEAAVLLIDPKYPHNVGNALRACALLGASRLFWTGDRVPPPDSWPSGSRLPREERLRCYRRTELVHLDAADNPREVKGLTPVCVEISDTAEDLLAFQHPERALYVFGPEDGEVPKTTRMACHRFVRIPNAIPAEDPDSRTPYNLAAAVNVVLYDRLVKASVLV
jgi:tRNA(Leu) C34 or U34 (ribose-2'-O)-methylase TrmL